METPHRRSLVYGQRAVARRARSKDGKLRLNPELRQFVQQHLDQRWSPEQISQALRQAFPSQPEMHLAPETIYQALYRPERGGLHGDAAKTLRTDQRTPPPTTCPGRTGAGAPSASRRRQPPTSAARREFDSPSPFTGLHHLSRCLSPSLSHSNRLRLLCRLWVRARYSASGISPTSARRWSTSSGSAISAGTLRSPSQRSWVP